MKKVESPVGRIIEIIDGHDSADSAISQIRSIGIKFVDVDCPTTQIAAGYKAQGGICYADCFAAALVRARAVATEIPVSCSPAIRNSISVRTRSRLCGSEPTLYPGTHCIPIPRSN